MNPNKMKQHIIKDKVFKYFAKFTLAFSEVLKYRRNIQAKVEGQWYVIPYSDRKELYAQMMDFSHISSIAKVGKSILFRSDQAQVFTSVHEKYFETLDYKLPFGSVFLQFDQPISIDYQKRHERDVDRSQLIALALYQEVFTRTQIEADVNQKDKRQRDFDVGELGIREFTFNEHDEAVFNRICFLYADWGIDSIAWQSGSTSEELNTFDGVRFEAVSLWKNVAIACIGYINCENVYLQREGGADDATNQRRVSKGKSRLEPYYVCRIRGVQYDSAGNPTGEGAKHGIRYDVRGHFRRMADGKTTWVRPHQRGLANELYVPKTYVVDKRTIA